jgi:hypothetical protein
VGPEYLSVLPFRELMVMYRFAVACLSSCDQAHTVHVTDT